VLSYPVKLMLSQTHLYPFSAAAAQSTDLEDNTDTKDTNLLVAVACKLVSYCPYGTKLVHCKSIFKPSSTRGITSCSQRIGSLKSGSS
jgi:hypothetical protein